MSARHLTLVGHTKDGQTTLAQKCCICGEWLTVEDELLDRLGADTSHGYHPECAREYHGDDLPPDNGE